MFSDKAMYVLLSVSVDFFPDLCYNVGGLLCPVGNPQVTIILYSVLTLLSIENCVKTLFCLLFIKNGR